MHVYLPIAQMVVNIFDIISLGFIAGIASGLFGIGGGIIATPMMIFFGIPTSVAVGTASLQILGTSFAGTIKNLRGNNIDFTAGTIMFIGGYIGSTFGEIIFTWLKQHGHIDLAIAIIFALVTMIVTIILLADVFFGEQIMKRSIKRKMQDPNYSRRLKSINNKNTKQTIFAVYSPIANRYYNAIYLIALGALVGTIGAIIGIGGALISVPVMTYFLRLPFKSAAATALYQTMLTSINLLILQAHNSTIDVVLGCCMLIGAVFSVHIGVKLASILPVKITKFLLAVIVAILCVLFLLKVFAIPKNIFFVE
jgi:uncharacterized membrane protein YfcA